jgi:hypothetical protein
MQSESLYTVIQMPGHLLLTADGRAFEFSTTQ